MTAASTPHGSVVVIGAGIAGLLTCLKLAPLPVTLVSLSTTSDTAAHSWIGGSLAAAVGHGDSPVDHARDAMAAAAGLSTKPDNDEALALAVVGQAGDSVRYLAERGVVFDGGSDGALALSPGGGHTASRCLTVGGDRTGHAILKALEAAVRRTPSIRVLEGYRLQDLKLTDGRISRVVLTRADDAAAVHILGPVSDVILATGGIGGLYLDSTNRADANGEGLAIAARAGAAIADSEFVQFHPTVLDGGSVVAPVVFEVLSGAGAQVLNAAGERIMTALDPKAELAPRDVVARAVAAELNGGRGAFLDCRSVLAADMLRSAFPGFYAACRSAGIDPATQLIPVHAVEHFHIGGVRTDRTGRTNVAGLWAVGEVAATGLHGACTLAGDALLETLVFAAWVAAAIKADHHGGPVRIPARLKREKATRLPDEGARQAARALIRATMSRHVGIIRTETGLRTALATLADITAAADGDQVIINMTTAARFVAEAALRRKESRGVHARSDYAATDAKLARRSSITLAGLDLRSGLAASDIMNIVTHAGRAVADPTGE